jgi:hypothetical protein
MAEIDADVTKSTGCNLNNKYIWTSSTCGTNKYWAAKGKGNGKHRCLNADRKKTFVQCCANSAGGSSVGASAAVASSMAAALSSAADAESSDTANSGSHAGAAAVGLVVAALLVAAVGLAISRRSTTSATSANTANTANTTTDLDEVQVAEAPDTFERSVSYRASLDATAGVGAAASEFADVTFTLNGAADGGGVRQESIHRTNPAYSTRDSIFIDGPSTFATGI